MMRQFLTVEEMCRKLRPVFGEKIDSVYSQYSLTDSLDLKRQIEQVINMMYQKYLNENLLSEKVLLEPPSQNIIEGDYPLGKVVYPDKELYTFGLRECDWQRHMLVSGMSGSGKTNFAYIIAGGLILKNKPFMILDWKKSFRYLMKVNDDILLFTIGNKEVSNHLKLNINKPPKNVNPKEWIMALCDILSEVFMTSFGVHKLLSEVMDRAYADFGIYNGSNNYPTWFQIKDRLEEMAYDLKRGRESEWLTSAIRIAHILTFGDFGQSVNYKGKDSIGVDELLEKMVIFEMNSLSTVEKKFFSDYLLTYIYKFKKANTRAENDFKHAILVDEAHNIFLKDKTNFNTESITDMIYREIREYGTSLICMDQHVSKLSEVVVGNSACVVAFQQFLPYDLNAISGVMQLYESRKFYTMLPVGYAIVRLAERFHSPFLIKVPFVDVNKHVSDDEIKTMMKQRHLEYKKLKLLKQGISTKRLKKEIDKLDYKFYSSGVNATKEFIESQVPNLVQESGDDELAEEYGAYKTAKKAGLSDSDNIFIGEIKDKLSDECLSFIKHLANEEDFGTVQVYNSLGLSVRRGNKIRDSLVDLGLIAIKEERSSKGWKKVLLLTDMAQNIIDHIHI